MRASALWLLASGPGCAPHAPPDAVAVAPSCARCHPDEAREHGRSRHARSATSPPYVLAVAATATPDWCRGCHEPGPSGQVGCAQCHPAGAGGPDPRHPLHPDDGDAAGARCQGCHEFPMVADHPLGASDVLVQSTWTESLDSGGDGRTCPDCHDHRARGAHHPAFVRGALEVEVEPDGDRVAVTLTARDIGHRLPTGDLFRQLWVSSHGEGGRLLGAHVFGRALDVDPVRVRLDNRLWPDEPVKVTLPAGRVAVELRLVDPQHRADLPPSERRTVVCDPCR